MAVLSQPGAPLGNRNASRDKEIKPCNTRRKYGTVAHWLARLDRDRPDLAAQVRAGELSPHAAAKQAGWRREQTPLEKIRAQLPRLSEDERTMLRADLDRISNEPDDTPKAEAPLFTGPNRDFGSLQRVYEAIERVALDELGLSMDEPPVAALSAGTSAEIGVLADALAHRTVNDMAGATHEKSEAEQCARSDNYRLLSSLGGEVASKPSRVLAERAQLSERSHVLLRNGAAIVGLMIAGRTAKQIAKESTTGLSVRGVIDTASKFFAETLGNERYQPIARNGVYRNAREHGREALQIADELLRLAALTSSTPP